jgi:hypothetical protein
LHSWVVLVELEPFWTAFVKAAAFEMSWLRAAASYMVPNLAEAQMRSPTWSGSRPWAASESLTDLELNWGQSSVKLTPEVMKLTATIAL